ncbi:MAG: L-histidine N(alpha)-methyltransferase, partial [Methylobacteriaceae bacterium]
ENSYKYTVERFQALSGEAGWIPTEVWTDPERLFSIHALRRP